MHISPSWILAVLALAIPAGRASARAPQAQPKEQSSPSASMPNMPNMPGMPHGSDESGHAGRAANDAMSGHDMRMNAHMYMTTLRPQNGPDDAKAQAIIETLRTSIARYRDYKLAVADGYQVFMPNVSQPVYHFTNYSNGFQAAFSFDPSKPTSLLYKKTADGYELVGAMYTAAKGAPLDELNARVPLSVARWHKHVNFCMPAQGTPWSQIDGKKFGLEGSIVTQETCSQVGGRWIPQVFGWMVHVYPFETDPAKQFAH